MKKTIILIFIILLNACSSIEKIEKRNLDNLKQNLLYFNDHRTDQKLYYSLYHSLSKTSCLLSKRTQKAISQSNTYSLKEQQMQKEFPKNYEKTKEFQYIYQKLFLLDDLSYQSYMAYDLRYYQEIAKKMIILEFSYVYLKNIVSRLYHIKKQDQQAIKNTRYNILLVLHCIDKLRFILSKKDY